MMEKHFRFWPLADITFWLWKIMTDISYYLLAFYGQSDSLINQINNQ